MSKAKKTIDPFTELTWADLEEWAGSRIVSRGKRYQRNGCVSELARTADDGLIAWVEGSRRYATMVEMRDGELLSHCTCPYELNCKHAVAAVVDYLDRLKKRKALRTASRSDERLKLLEFDEPEDASQTLEDEEFVADITDKQAIADYLEAKTKSELIQLFLEVADRHSVLCMDLLDRIRLESGRAQPIVKRLRYLIREVSSEPGWQNYWRGEGHTPDYSEIRAKLQELLAAGHADDVLSLGAELMKASQRQVESSHDDGETGQEISSCMPVIAKALQQSSLPAMQKLVWATDAVLKDEYGLFEPLAEYLNGRHEKEAWSELADILLKRLKGSKSTPASEFSRNYERDKLSGWAIHALEHAGRKKEIIPLCEKEAPLTASYSRLVNFLISEGRLQDAERWIHQGIDATESKLPGIASELRRKLLEIRRRQKDRMGEADLLIDEFIRFPGEESFAECKKAAEKLKIWPAVRSGLLAHLETGRAPDTLPDWPLSKTGAESTGRSAPSRFPLIEKLIGIAIYEKDPDRIIHWYDRLPKQGFIWRGSIGERVAAAVKDTHPERTIAIWKALAERLIQETKPRAYRDAADYLRWLAKLLTEKGRANEWTRYLAELRAQHARKRALLEILETLEKRPIVKIR
jgi:uncharacterized Zn finger protein